MVNFFEDNNPFQKFNEEFAKSVNQINKNVEAMKSFMVSQGAFNDCTLHRLKNLETQKEQDEDDCQNDTLQKNENAGQDLLPEVLFWRERYLDSIDETVKCNSCFRARFMSCFTLDILREGPDKLVKYYIDSPCPNPWLSNFARNQSLNNK